MTINDTNPDKIGRLIEQAACQGSDRVKVISPCGLRDFPKSDDTTSDTTGVYSITDQKANQNMTCGARRESVTSLKAIIVDDNCKDEHRSTSHKMTCKRRENVFSVENITQIAYLVIGYLEMCISRNPLNVKRLKNNETTKDPNNGSLILNIGDVVNILTLLLKKDVTVSLNFIGLHEVANFLLCKLINDYRYLLDSELVCVSESQTILTHINSLFSLVMFDYVKNKNDRIKESPGYVSAVDNQSDIVKKVLEKIVPSTVQKTLTPIYLDKTDPLSIITYVHLPHISNKKASSTKPITMSVPLRTSENGFTLSAANKEDGQISETDVHPTSTLDADSDLFDIYDV